MALGIASTIAGLALLALGSGTVSAAAQVPMVGRFVAEASCFATPSIRSEDNPGRIVTEPGRGYDLIGRNASPGSHYLIRVPDASPDRRWVAFGCGRIEEPTQSAAAAPPSSQSKSSGGRDAGHGSYVLAASWHPAFCEMRQGSRECRGGGSVGNGFTLHGLWPQPRGREYCGVSDVVRRTDERGDWQSLPDFDVSSQTRRAIREAMPGVEAGLDRHEWWVHGTCFGGDAETYFSEALRLLDELNMSSVRILFDSSIGESIAADEVRAAFDEAFGRGAGKRVLVDCADDASGEPMIRELRVALAGDLSKGAGLGDLIRAGETVGRGCRSGRVDAPGFD